MPPMPDIVDLPRGNGSSLLILPQRVQLWGSEVEKSCTQPQSKGALRSWPSLRACRSLLQSQRGPAVTPHGSFTCEPAICDVKHEADPTFVILFPIFFLLLIAILLSL